jgi:hypothetical protein
MYRDEDDLRLLAELAGVLDQTVTAAGLSAGSYMVLRELVEDPGPVAITQVAERLKAGPDEVAALCVRLKESGLATARPAGMEATEEGRAAAGRIEADANVAMRDYVLERPHTATVYGLVASMQSGRFTVRDLLEFLAEDPEDDEDEG